MKFSCTQENLNSGLNLVGHVAARGASLPILSNVLLRTTRAGLELTATNLEVAVTVTVRGKVEKEGAITVQGRLLTEAVSFFPKERIDIEMQDMNMLVRGGKQRTTIRGLAADDFPVIPEVSAADELTVEAAELAQALAQVNFAINPDEGRPEISGVYLAWGAEGLVLAGTDSYRLAERKLSSAHKPHKPIQVIVPLRAAQEVARIASQTTGQAVIAVGENQILWKLGDTKIVSRLISGQYPDYQQIIPRNLPTRLEILRAELTQAIKAAGLFVRSGINDVRLQANPKAKTIQISSANTQLGENVTEVELTSASGKDTEIVFNYRYLLDGLQAITGESVVLELGEAKTPGVLKPADGPDGSYLYIIMPIRQ